MPAADAAARGHDWLPRQLSPKASWTIAAMQSEQDQLPEPCCSLSHQAVDRVAPVNQHSVRAQSPSQAADISPGSTSSGTDLSVQRNPLYDESAQPQIEGSGGLASYAANTAPAAKQHFQNPLVVIAAGADKGAASDAGHNKVSKALHSVSG